MSLLFQKHIAGSTKLGVWKIEENEDFFLKKIRLQQTIHHPHKRLQHLAGRYLLSVLCFDFPYKEILLNEAGKPYLLSNQYQFSISHCGNYAAVIISRENACGIDVELFSPKTETVKHKYLSNDELTYVNGFQNSHKRLFLHHQLYTLCWCAKEAVYKWWGRGKIDFKQNIIIQNINIEEKKMKVDFNHSSVKTNLNLQLMLLQQLSLVWTIT